MQVDLLEAAGFLTAMSVILGALFGVFTFYADSKRQRAEIKSIKRELSMVCEALTACLNGLEQLGADGDVHDVLKKMNTHINQSAHDQEE